MSELAGAPANGKVHVWDWAIGTPGALFGLDFGAPPAYLQAALGRAVVGGRV